MNSPLQPVLVALFKGRSCYELQVQFSALLSHLHAHLLFSVLYPGTCLWIWGLPNYSEVFNKNFAYLSEQMQSEEFWNEKAQWSMKVPLEDTNFFCKDTTGEAATVFFLALFSFTIATDATCEVLSHMEVEEKLWICTVSMGHGPAMWVLTLPECSADGARQSPWPSMTHQNCCPSSCHHGGPGTNLQFASAILYNSTITGRRQSKLWFLEFRVCNDNTIQSLAWRAVLPMSSCMIIILRLLQWLFFVHWKSITPLTEGQSPFLSSFCNGQTTT